MTDKKHDVWQSSEYISMSLEKKTKSDIYKEKLTLEQDPYGLSNNWKSNVLLLPDIISCLINIPSASYTHENLKAYKSLKAFNFLVYNHVQDVFYHSISKKLKFCCVKTKVKGKMCDLKKCL